MQRQSIPLSKEIGRASVPVKAYVYQYRKMVSLANRPKEIRHFNKKRRLMPLKTSRLHKHVIDLKKVSTVQQKLTSLKTQAPSSAKSEATRGEHNRLLQLLHNAIATTQRYPRNALLLNQHGTTTIQFVLYPNGIIDHIIIIKSSNYALLDKAAISAVRAIQPFYTRKKLLRTDEHFKVAIEF